MFEVLNYKELIRKERLQNWLGGETRVNKDRNQNIKPAQ